MRRTILVPGLLAGLLATLPSCGFTESSSRYSTRERQIEARTEGDLELRYAWVDDGTLLVVAPLHAAGGRTEFSRARLDALTHADGPRLWLAVTLWDFHPPAAAPAAEGPGPQGAAPLAFAREGVPVTATLLSMPAGTSGKVATLAPSKLLGAVTDPGAKPLIATITGAGALPRLTGGQSLQIVAALPTSAPLADLTDVQVELATRSVALARVTVSALQWDEFRSQPTRPRFDALIAAPGPAKEGASGDRDSRK